MADRWGLTIPMDVVAQVKDTEGFERMVADALEMRS
jgi:hypothetical protein